MFSNNRRPPLKKCENVRRDCDAVYFSIKALQKILGGKGKKKKKKHVLSTTVQILDVITSFPVMMYRRKKMIK
jgi:hypothetical protein